MQIVYESGHVLAAWLSGAAIEQVVLLPISRAVSTDPNDKTKRAERNRSFPLRFGGRPNR